MGFDLNNYETVKERKKRFYSDNSDGRIIVELVNNDVLEHALFRATVYKNIEDQAAGLPWATGYAHELRDMEMSVSSSGKEYQSINYSAWVENCEESAIGRALDNAGYSGNNKCSREEMQKATRPQQISPIQKFEAFRSKLPKHVLEYVGTMNKKDQFSFYEENGWDVNKVCDVVEEEIKKANGV